jgi:hypothetical protein
MGKGFGRFGRNFPDPGKRFQDIGKALANFREWFRECSDAWLTLRNGFGKPENLHSTSGIKSFLEKYPDIGQTGGQPVEKRDKNSSKRKFDEAMR